MGNYGISGTMMNQVGLLGLITWIVLIVFLVLGGIYFWKEINRRK